MSRQSFRIDMGEVIALSSTAESAVTLMPEDALTERHAESLLLKDSYVAEQSEYPSLKRFFALTDPEVSDTGVRDEVLIELVRSLASTASSDLEAIEYKAEYSEIPFSEEAISYIKKVSELGDNDRKLGKIAALAALSLIDGKDLGEAQRDAKLALESFAEVVDEQVRRDQERTNLYITLGDRSFSIPAIAGRTNEELKKAIEDIGAGLTEEQVGYVMRSYDQFGSLGAGALWSGRCAQGAGLFSRNKKADLFLDVRPDSVQLTVNQLYEVVNAESGKLDMLVTSLSSDISSLRGDGVTLPGLASQKITPVLRVTTVSEKPFLVAAPVFDASRDFSSHLKEYSAMQVIEANIATIEDARELLAKFPETLAPYMIAEMHNQKYFGAELIENYGASKRMTEEAKNTLYQDVIALQASVGSISHLLAERFKIIAKDSGAVQFSDMADMIYVVAQSKKMNAVAIDSLCSAISHGLGMDDKNQKELHAAVLAKEVLAAVLAKEVLASPVTLETAAIRLGDMQRMEYKDAEALIKQNPELAAKSPVSRLKRMFSRQKSDNKIWAPSPAELDATPPLSDVSSLTGSISPVELFTTPSVASAKTPSFVERYAPGRASPGRASPGRASPGRASPGSRPSFAEEVTAARKVSSVEKVGKE